jgi:hypothetical protein
MGIDWPVMPTIRELSRQPTPEKDFIGYSRSYAELQLFIHRHFPPQLIEKIEKED